MSGQADRAAFDGKADPRTRPPRASRSGRRRALLLALLVHGLLLALLFFGLKWQSRPEAPVQAELWTPAQSAAPAAPSKPEPAPEPKPQPEPEPKPQSEPKPPPAPEPKPTPKPVPKLEPKAETTESPDIRAERLRKEAERKQAEDKRRKDEQQRRDAERKEATERKDAERKEADRKEAERKAAERKAAEERQKREDAERREAQAAETRRTEDIRRMQQQAAASSGPADAPVRSAPSGGQSDAGYRARVASAIRTNTTFQIPADLEGNPRAVFAVQLRPDCSVASVRLRRSSGYAAWDQAAERGIQRTDPFPRPADGPCSSEVEISRGPRDQR